MHSKSSWEYLGIIQTESVKDNGMKEIMFSFLGKIQTIIRNETKKQCSHWNLLNNNYELKLEYVFKMEYTLGLLVLGKENSK